MKWLKKKEREVGELPPPIRGRAADVNAKWRDFNRDRVIRQPKIPLLGRDTHVFTMGSCFANELRDHLNANGMGVLGPTVPAEVLPRMHDASRERSSWGAWNGLSNLQWYNTFSIRQEIERAAGLWPHDPADHWRVEIEGESLVQCPYRRRIFARTAEDLAEVTRAIDAKARADLEAAELVIMTLGLTEVWRKKDNGRIACAEPGYCRGGGHEETELVASTYEQNHENVVKTIELIREHFGPKRFAITVSPVALGRTFRDGMDIAIANMESKSILRAVAGRVQATEDDVTYFPAYEMCMLDPASFMPDGRHVRREKVDQIMELFVACHAS